MPQGKYYEVKGRERFRALGSHFSIHICSVYKLGLFALFVWLLNKESWWVLSSGIIRLRFCNHILCCKPLSPSSFSKSNWILNVCERIAYINRVWKMDTQLPQPSSRCRLQSTPRNTPSVSQIQITFMLIVLPLSFLILIPKYAPLNTMLVLFVLKLYIKHIMLSIVG